MKSFIFPRNRIVVRNKGSDFYICPHSFSSCHLTASVRMNNNARNSRWEIFLRVTPPISAPDLGSSLRYYKSLNFCAMDLKFWRYVSNSMQFLILKEFFDILKKTGFIYFFKTPPSLWISRLLIELQSSSKKQKNPHEQYIWGRTFFKISIYHRFALKPGCVKIPPL